VDRTPQLGTPAHFRTALTGAGRLGADPGKRWRRLQDRLIQARPDGERASAVSGDMLRSFCQEVSA